MHEVVGRLFSSRSRAFIFALVLAAATIFAYRPAWNGGFLWDDDVYITNNETLTATDGLLLLAHAACMDCVFWPKNKAALAVLCTRADPLSIGTFGQDNSLHAAGCVVFDFVAAEEAHQLETNFPDYSLLYSRHRYGRISDVVGAVPSGDKPDCFYVPEPHRTGSRREPCHLVLSEQTRLAI